MKRTLLAVGLLLFLLLSRCKHEILYSGGIPVDDPPLNTGSCSPDSVYFANDIQPLIASNCAMSGCHDPISREEGLVLNYYSGIMKIVRAGNARESKLFKVISTSNLDDLMPPPPHSRLSATSIAAIEKWINQGAKNNLCNSQCDTTVFTYSSAVIPIINTSCRGCHNPASLGGGLDLTNYNTVKSIGINGKLLGSIKNLPGFVAMPQSGGKLEECKVKQIEKWIQAGALNN